MSAVHRIALVSGGLGLGGATTFLINLAGELVRRGIAVHVYSFEANNPLGCDFEREKIPLLVCNDRRTIFEDRLRIILSALSDFQPTALIGTLGPASLEPLRYAPAGVQRVAMIQSDYPELYPTFVPYAACIDAIAAVSKRIRKLITGMPEFANTAAHYLPYGVPIKPLVRLELDQNSPLRVLYFGRLCRPQKRVHLFPEILTELRQNNVPIAWAIAGDGEERAFLERTMISDDCRRIRFLGPLAYQQIPATLAEHDVFLLTSDAEGLPLSLLEAMGAGLVPVVSRLESGVCDIVNMSNGMLVDPSRTSGYAEALATLNQDRAALRAKSIAAHAAVRSQFSVTAMADRWLSALRSAEAPPVWPKILRLEPIAGTKRPWYFSPAVRIVRRIASGLWR